MILLCRQYQKHLSEIMPTRHQPVLLRESVQALQAQKGGVFVDATLGGGGHAEEILKAHPNNILIGIDRDSMAISRTEERLKKYGDRAIIVHSPFSAIETIVDDYADGRVDGIIADLGVSSDQIEDRNRGFSFQVDGPLDMRMDPATQKNSAAVLLAESSEDEIECWLKEFGEERFARKIANTIINQRRFGPILRTSQLADLVAQNVRSHKSGHHPATKTFQALRIAVNRELDEVKMLLNVAPGLLRKDGRLGVITFHSLEDRAVKLAFRNQTRGGLFENLYKKGIVPNASEVASNPRSRSSRLRVLSRKSI